MEEESKEYRWETGYEKVRTIWLLGFVLDKNFCTFLLNIAPNEHLYFRHGKLSKKIQMDY